MSMKVTGVSLETEHKPNKVVDIVVKVEILGKWIEVIRTPYADDGAISHSVFEAGLLACYKDRWRE